MPGDAIDDEEVTVGLVLHIDPDALESAGATFTCPATSRVQGSHFFVCVDAEGGRWAPLFTAGNPGRVAVDVAGSSGHPKVTAGTPHYHPGQIWTAAPDQIRAGAAAGGDMSRASGRNRFDGSQFAVL
jgi:hypothetical protein